MGERYRRIEDLVALVTLLVFLQDSNKKEGDIIVAAPSFKDCGPDELGAIT